MSKLTQISHDAFSRQSILRETIKPGIGDSCDWCGCRNRFDKLFRYYVESDGLGARPNPIKGEFCSIQCMRDYHNN